MIDIKIKCARTRDTRPDKLKPHPKNPNKHSEQQIATLAHIIENVGFRSPIVISKRSGYVIKGHARLAAANMLEAMLVPVDDQDYASEAEEWQDLIADNRMSELAELDYAAVKLMVEDVEVWNDFDLDLTGFDLFNRSDIKKKHESTNNETQTQEIQTTNSKEQGIEATKEGAATPSDVAANHVTESAPGVRRCPNCGCVLEGSANG